MAFRPPAKTFRSWQFDSGRWQHHAPRLGDIVIATYPKCGTTWMQRIVSLLVFQHTDPLPVMDISVWLDARFQLIDAVVAAVEAQTHRRFLKAHQSYDALPIHDTVRYILVARDGRDAALSYHHHLMCLSDELLARYDALGLEDDTIARPFPRPPADPAEFFHRWMTRGIGPDTDGLPLPSYFEFQRSWWAAKERENVLMVHHSDLRADLDGEMRRIAAFLGVETPEELWPRLVETAGFAAMQKEGAGLLGRLGGMVFRDGGASFIHCGTNGRWRDVFHADDLALYDAALARLPEDCARWLRAGRLGDPSGKTNS